VAICSRANREGNWTYQFAVVVDDWRQDIDLVVRGEDLLDSTGRQIQLARLLDAPSLRVPASPAADEIANTETE